MSKKPVSSKRPDPHGASEDKVRVHVKELHNAEETMIRLNPGAVVPEGMLGYVDTDGHRHTGVAKLYRGRYIFETIDRVKLEVQPEEPQAA